MDGSNIILDKILDMIEEFEDIKKLFYEGQDRKNIETCIDRIYFIEEKLSILKIAILDEVTRKHCIDLKKSIDNFKKEEDLDEYNNKIKLIKGLNYLTNIMDNLRGIEIIYIIESLFRYISLNLDDINSLSRDKLVYLNALGTKQDYTIKAEGMSPGERLAYAKELILSLFDYCLNSYNENNKPFNLFEKIMIINILDTIKFYLRYK